MTHTLVAVAAGALLLALTVTSCSSDSSSAATTMAPAAAAAPATTAAPNNGSGIAPISQTRSLTCDQDRQTLELAIQAYEAVNGTPPADEAALVPDLLREQVPGWDLDAAGNVIPAPGGTCA